MSYTGLKATYLARGVSVYNIDDFKNPENNGIYWLFPGGTGTPDNNNFYFLEVMCAHDETHTTLQRLTENGTHDTYTRMHLNSYWTGWIKK